MPALEKATGEKFPPGDQLHTQETNEFLKRICKRSGVECPPPLTNARMIDKLVGEFIEEKCVNPTFITGPSPDDVSAGKVPPQHAWALRTL